MVGILYIFNCFGDMMIVFGERGVDWLNNSRTNKTHTHMLARILAYVSELNTTVNDAIRLIPQHSLQPPFHPPAHAHQ